MPNGGRAGSRRTPSRRSMCGSSAIAACGMRGWIARAITCTNSKPTKKRRRGMPARNSDTRDSASRETAATRLLDAPRELVWAVWTDPKHVAKWWGPNGFTNTIREMDVKPGGRWRFVMHGPDGTDYENEVVFTEIVKPSLLAYDHLRPKFHVTVSFADQGGKSRLA